MKRRNFLIGTGSAALGGSAILGSGAFTRVEAQRRAKIQVAHDSNAYLGLDRCHLDGEPAPNGSYIDFQDGHLAIEMSPDNPTNAGGQGVNSDSLTWFDNVFQICNNGKQTVCVWIEDSANWPRVDDSKLDGDYSAYDGMRRVNFYLGDDDETTIIGQENFVELEVGECVCVGLNTITKGLVEGDQLLEDLDDEIVIHADADCPEEELECPRLDGEYECTTYTEENGNWVRTGTRFRVYNEGPETTFDLAVANQPGTWRSDVPIGANTDRSVIADASFPFSAIIAWDPGEECRAVLQEKEDIETWGQYKERTGIEDLTDWYETFGTSGVPGDAPEDLDDELVVQVKNIPEEEKGTDIEDRIGPDEDIDDDLYPDMSEEAEDEGWITCAKFDGAND